MSTALWPIQVALVARLKATAGVVALVGQRIYDGEAPQGAARPYIVVGEGTEEPQNAFGSEGLDDTVTCHVFSDYNGRKEAFEIVAAMDAALVTALTITGWGSAHMRPDFATILVEADGTRHVPRRYRILARKA